VGWRGGSGARGGGGGGGARRGPRRPFGWENSLDLSSFERAVPRHRCSAIAAMLARKCNLPSHFCDAASIASDRFYFAFIHEVSDAHERATDRPFIGNNNNILLPRNRRWFASRDREIQVRSAARSIATIIVGSLSQTDEAFDSRITAKRESARRLSDAVDSRCKRRPPRVTAIIGTLGVIVSRDPQL